MRGVCRARNEEWRTKYGSLYRKYVGRLIIREGERALPLRVESTWPPPSLRSTPRRSNRGGHEVLSSILFTREACLLAPFLHLLLSSARVDYREMSGQRMDGKREAGVFRNKF